MHAPGKKHYKAILHLLHHLRCHPPKAIKFYHKVEQSPLAVMLRRAGYEDVDPTFVYFSDSSWADEPNQRSTGSYTGFLQGGLVDCCSFTPNPIAMSSAEAESNAICVTTIAAIPVRQAFLEIIFGNPERDWTLTIFTDSLAAITMITGEKVSKATKHIERRYLFNRQAYQQGRIRLLYLSGKDYMLADLGTKNVPTPEAEYKLSILEVDVPSPSKTTSQSEKSPLAKEG